jgi:hypothetical protein
LPLNRWTFLAAASDGEAVRLYLDGKLDAEVEQRAALGFNGNPLSIGAGLERARAVNREVYPLIRFFDARRLQGYLDDATEALRQQPASVRHTEAVLDKALRAGV